MLHNTFLTCHECIVRKINKVLYVLPIKVEGYNTVQFALPNGQQNDKPLSGLYITLYSNQNNWAQLRRADRKNSGNWVKLNIVQKVIKIQNRNVPSCWWMCACARLTQCNLKSETPTLLINKSFYYWFPVIRQFNLSCQD